MEIILIQDVDKIGRSGQVVKVKDGFARNFLIPNGFAVPSNSANLRKLRQEDQSKQLKLEKAKNEAEGLKVKLEALSLTLPVLTQDDERLYASITAQDITAALKEEGFQIDKNSIILDDPLKSLGIFEVPVKLHPQVEAKVKVWIVKK